MCFRLNSTIKINTKTSIFQLHFKALNDLYLQFETIYKWFMEALYNNSSNQDLQNFMGMESYLDITKLKEKDDLGLMTI